MLLLFFGFAFLLKYAADNSMLPVELRLAGVALGGCALLAAGWKLRLKRRGYALILQGGGVGTLYITAFVTLKFFQLLPPGLTLAFLILLGAASAWLAIRQDAPSLAGMGITGGFLAPILTSTGGGSHVVLFGYYALLNAGIFGIAWRKSWRSLNLLGFAFTFVVATAWGALQYRPEQLASTLPFLALFFCFYLGISILYALRQGLALRHYVDGTLVFGTPLVSSGLAAALLRNTPFGMAWCAAALAAVYLLLASWLRRCHALPLLADAFLALGVIFATLAVPLAFDGRTTTALWAVEGAGLLWISLRQQRRLGRWFALGLQLCAGAACLGHLQHMPGDWPVLNSSLIACLLLALSGLFSGWQLQRRGDAHTVLPAALAAWAGLWWLGGGIRELGLFLPDRPFIDGVMLLLSFSLALCSLLRRRLDWKLLAYPALALPTATLAWSLFGLAGHDRPLAGLGGIAAPVSLAASLWLLRRHEDDAKPTDWLHACWLWALAALAAREAGWWLWQWLPEGVWRNIALPLTAGSLLLLLSGPLRRLVWPLRRHPAAYLGYGPAPLFPALVGWMLWSLLSDGDPAPLFWLPLLNPLDIAYGFALLALCAWLLRLNRQWPGLPRDAAAWLLCPAILLAVSADVLRAFHHWGGMMYSPTVLWSVSDSRIVLALAWCALALLAPRLAAGRDGGRAAVRWSAGVGAALLLWMLLANLDAGSPLLLPWLPLLNPLELAQLAVLACVWINWRRAGFPRHGSGPWLDYAIAAWLIGFGCAIVLRALHHWQGVIYSLDTPLRAPFPQTVLMLCWSLLALAAPRLAAGRPGAAGVVSTPAAHRQPRAAAMERAGQPGRQPDAAAAPHPVAESAGSGPVGRLRRLLAELEARRAALGAARPLAALDRRRLAVPVRQRRGAALPAPLAGHSLPLRRAAAFHAHPGDAVAGLDAGRAGPDGGGHPPRPAAALAVRRHAADAGGGQAVPGRPGLGRQHSPHRQLHRRRSAVPADRLPVAAAAAGRAAGGRGASMRRALSLSAALLALPVLAGPTAGEFARRQPIILDGPPAALYRLDLPADIYRASTRSDLADMQVFNAVGEAVPWVIAPARGAVEPARDYALPAFALPALAKPGRSAGIVLDTRGLPTAGRESLALELEQDAYRGSVALSASDDGERWQPLAVRELLKLSGDPRPLRLDLRSNASRYLRLEWRDKPFQLGQARLRVGASSAPAPLQQGEWTRARQGAAGEYLFDLGLSAPLKRLEVELPHANTSVHGAWFRRERANQPWQKAFDSELTQQGQRVPLPLAELDGGSDRYWRLVVETQQGGLGDGLPRLRASWPLRQLTFAARGQPPFTLAYGLTGFAVVRQADSLLDSREPAQPATLGTALSGGTKPAARASAATPRKSLWLWGSLLLAVGMLGWISYRLLRDPE